MRHKTLLFSFLLIVLMLSGGSIICQASTVATASTASESSNTKSKDSGLSFGLFFEFSKQDNCYQNVEISKVLSKLKKKGFKLVSTKKVKDFVYDPVGPEDLVEVEVTQTVYSCNGTKVIIQGDLLKSIKFKDKSSLNKFLSEMKSVGWTKEGNMYGWDKFNYGQAIDAVVEGLKISFSTGE